MGNAQRTWNEAIRPRLDMTTYALGHIKDVRLLGLTEAVSSIIQNLRRNEVQK
jgi:ATP-binding cassette, subfamily C (CFTR/MRP), member 1